MSIPPFFDFHYQSHQKENVKHFKNSCFWVSHLAHTPQISSSFRHTREPGSDKNNSCWTPASSCILLFILRGSSSNQSYKVNHCSEFWHSKSLCGLQKIEVCNSFLNMPSKWRSLAMSSSSTSSSAHWWSVSSKASHSVCKGREHQGRERRAVTKSSAVVGALILASSWIKLFICMNSFHPMR